VSADNNESEERLRNIYDGLCEVIEKKVKNSPSDVTAADIQAIRGFLKDNGISSVRRPGNSLDRAAGAVESMDEGGFPFAVSGKILSEDDPAVKQAAGK